MVTQFLIKIKFRNCIIKTLMDNLVRPLVLFTHTSQVICHLKTSNQIDHQLGSQRTQKILKDVSFKSYSRYNNMILEEMMRSKTFDRAIYLLKVESLSVNQSNIQTKTSNLLKRDCKNISNKLVFASIQLLKTTIINKMPNIWMIK